MIRKTLTVVCLGSSLMLSTTAGAYSEVHRPAPKGNWISKLPPVTKARWVCRLWKESRSTLQAINLSDNNGAPGGNSGIFQIDQTTWHSNQAAVHVPFYVHVWQASMIQQFAVAQQIFKMRGFEPWQDSCF